MRTYALDTENFYDDEVSITTLGVWGYLRHPKSECYMVSVAGDDGYRWVGHPRDVDWERISGPDTFWVFHNAHYDWAVLDHLKEIDVMPAHINPGDWGCSADAAAYHGLPRNLKGAIEVKFKGVIEVSKQTRNAMKGQRWDLMTPEFQKEVSNYALHDADCCLALWKSLAPTWPHHERMLSQLTAWMGWKGLPVNREKIEAGIQHLKDQMWEAESQIPWAGTEKLLSTKALADECRKVGISPPKSLAQDSEECEEWLDTWGEKFPWIAAMRTWRRCNALLKKLETMHVRTRPDGRMSFELLYAGTHTLRDAGSGKWNCQNLHKGELFGVNVRELIEAPPGRTFVISDLSQIEPRTAAVLAGDTAFLDLLATGMHPYEAHARASMGWTGGELKSENPTIYGLAKARVLALGYGAGWHKFITMARDKVSPAEYQTIFGAPVTPDQVHRFRDYLAACQRIKKGDNKLAQFNALDPAVQRIWVNSWLQVEDFRKSNKKITDLWDRMKNALERASGSDLTIELPSGRDLVYKNVLRYADSITCVQVRQGVLMRSKVYGPLIVENLCQTVARDVFMHCVHKIVQNGHDVMLRIHDEVLVECDEKDAEAVRADVLKIMHTPPPWMPTLPVASSAIISKCYTK